MKALYDEKSGIKLHKFESFQEPMFVSKIEETSCKHFYRLPNEYSRLEKLLILSITDALQKVTVDIKNDNMLVIISTTKGNIDLIEDETKRDKLYLSS